MRYPCNLFGDPASSWLFWSTAVPERPHSQYLLEHSWRAAKKPRAVHTLDPPRMKDQHDRA